MKQLVTLFCEKFGDVAVLDALLDGGISATVTRFKCKLQLSKKYFSQYPLSRPKREAGEAEFFNTPVYFRFGTSPYAV